MGEEDKPAQRDGGPPKMQFWGGEGGGHEPFGPEIHWSPLE